MCSSSGLSFHVVKSSLASVAGESVFVPGRQRERPLPALSQEEASCCSVQSAARRATRTRAPRAGAHDSRDAERSMEATRGNESALSIAPPRPALSLSPLSHGPRPPRPLLSLSDFSLPSSPLSLSSSPPLPLDRLSCRLSRRRRTLSVW
eukprot:scaffold70712_cov31-Tisochrysis_lutea.AAC.6